MGITFINPAAEDGAQAVEYDLALDTSRRITIGLIANTFPDADVFMDELHQAFVNVLPKATIARHQKPGISPIEGDQAAAIQGNCDAVVTGWGH